MFMFLGSSTLCTSVVIRCRACRRWKGNFLTGNDAIASVDVPSVEGYYGDGVLAREGQQGKRPFAEDETEKTP